MSGLPARVPTLEASDPDAAWRAAALLHTIVRLKPLPHGNSLFAAFVAAQYMDQSGEGIDPRTAPCPTSSERSGTPG